MDIERRLKQICQVEKIELENEAIKKLARLSRGNLRAAINDLETVARGKGGRSKRFGNFALWLNYVTFIDPT